MAANPRVLLDTNIIVSALIYGGKPGKIFDLAIEKEIAVITSFPLLSELQEVLLKKFSFSELKYKQLEKKIKKRFLIVYPNMHIALQKDTDDNRVLEAAIAGKCQYIVTGDKELLDLGSLKRIKIMTSAQFLDVMKKQ